MLSRGSQWTKWDFHLHSPLTNLANNFHLTKHGWDPYFQAIVNAKVEGIAITNYFYFAENELEVIRAGLTAKGSKIAVLGNLEFRIQQPNKDGEFINIHVLFSDGLPTKTINERIGRLSLVNTRSDQRKIYCSNADITEAKLSTGDLMVDPAALAQVLSESFKENEYLIVCCLRGYGGMRPARPLPQEGRGASLAAELDKRCHCFFGSSADSAFALSKNRYEGAKAKAVLTGSDAHSLVDVGATTVWIKGELSFEGIRQVLYEPESRVSHLAINPATVFNKSSFESITLDGPALKGQTLSFTAASIPLNRDLVTIVGGRGTGKSLLIDILWRLFHRPVKDDIDRYRDLITEKAKVTFLTSDQDPPLVFLGSSSNSLSYLHVRQGEIKTLAEDANRLSSEVKRLIGIDDSVSSQSSYESVKYMELKSRIDSISSWLEEKDEEGVAINSRPHQEQLIQDMEGRLNAITNTSNELLVAEIQKISQEKSDLVRAVSDIADLRDTIIASERSINQKISAVNTNLKALGEIPSHSFNALLLEIEAAEAQLDVAISQNDSKSLQLIQQLSMAGITLDASGLVAKAELFQGAISDAKDRLDQIAKQNSALKLLIEERQSFAKSFLNDLQLGKQSIDSRFKALTDKNEQWNDAQNALVADLLQDIEVSGEIFFDEAEFYRLLMESLNLSKFRSTGTTSSERKVRAYLPINGLEDLVKLIEDVPIINDELGMEKGESFSQWVKNPEYFVSNPEISVQDLIFYPRYIRRYLSVRAKITYRKKELRRLSVGQRGTLYLCMKLATDPFGSPFVFDQPEDDLDNDFIVSHLIPLVRKVKQYRQVILVTHNANIVVNGDAEQIIIAKNEDEKLSYVAGGIETQNPVNIRKEICTILEGGSEAFRSRDLRYGLS